MAKNALAGSDLGSQLRAIGKPHQIVLALLAHVLNKPKTWILAHPETHLTPNQNEVLEGLVGRLQTGEPLPYVLGKQEFFGLDFEVSSAVLIPRPETELLVDQALEWLRAHPQARRAVDVGTGSGCIAVSLVSNCPDLRVTATDNSTGALELAARNAQRHHTQDRITFVECDLLPAELGFFDLLCANLPYIPSGKAAQVNSLPWEPLAALDGGADGLDLFRALFGKVRMLSDLPSLMLLEIEETLGEETLRLSRECFPEAQIHLLRDLAGKDRLVRIEKQP